MGETTSLVYGGRKFEIRPLTLRQIRDLLPALSVAAEGFGTESGIAACARILAAALGRDHPEMTFDTVLECETSPAEIAAAVNAVIELSGLVPAGEAKAGRD